jgi:hypothetical protein
VKDGASLADSIVSPSTQRAAIIEFTSMPSHHLQAEKFLLAPKCIKSCSKKTTIAILLSVLTPDPRAAEEIGRNTICSSPLLLF